MIFKRVRIIVAMLISLFLIGCDSGDSEEFSNSVDASEFTSIEISPDNGVVLIGKSVALTAYGNKVNSTQVNLNDNVTWLSSNPDVATVSSSGVLNVLKAGTTEISVRLANLSDVLVLNAVSTDQLSSITIETQTDTATPFESHLCGTVKFKANGFFDGIADSADITNDVIWEHSADVATAKFDIDHLNWFAITQANAGVITITAKHKSSDINASAEISLDGISIASLTVSPDPAEVAVGEQLNFTAQARYNDDSSADITRNATWSSSATPVSIDAVRGIATGVSTSESALNISASCGGVTDNAVVSVTEKKNIHKISIYEVSGSTVSETDRNERFELDGDTASHELKARVVYTDGSTEEITTHPDTTWDVRTWSDDGFDVFEDGNDMFLDVPNNAGAVAEVVVTYKVGNLEYEDDLVVVIK